MTRQRLILVLVMLAVGCLAPMLTPAATGEDRADKVKELARLQLEEERYRILRSNLESLQEAHAALTTKLRQSEERWQERLDAEIADLKKGQSKFVTREEFTKLANALKDLDEKRKTDHAALVKDLKTYNESIQALIADALKTAPAPAPVVAQPAPAPIDDYDGHYPYTVAAGDALMSIVNVYNDEVFAPKGLRISLNDVVRYNPGLNPNLIRPGQVINIPIPKK